MCPFYGFISGTWLRFLFLFIFFFFLLLAVAHDFPFVLAKVVNNFGQPQAGSSASRSSLYFYVVNLSKKKKKQQREREKQCSDSSKCQGFEMHRLIERSGCCRRYCTWPEAEAEAEIASSGSSGSAALWTWSGLSGNESGRQLAISSVVQFLTAVKIHLISFWNEFMIGRPAAGGRSAI